MVIEDVAGDLGEVFLALGIKASCYRLDQPGLERLVNQQVGILGAGDQRSGFNSVAADNQRAAPVIKPVADPRFDRAMIDPDRGNPEAVLFEHSHRIALADRGKRKRECCGTGTRWRNDFRAVMSCAISVISQIGGIVACNQRINSHRTVDRERGPRRTAGPARQHQRSDPVGMIRMEMGEEQPLDPARRNPHQIDVARAALANIDHEDMLARDHDIARPGTGWTWQW